MKKLIVVLTAFVTFNAAAQKTPMPAELKPFVQSGYQALAYGKQDLNGDGLQDYVLILKVQGEDTISAESPDFEAARPLLVITRKKDKSLQVAVTNNEVVMCHNCGGAFGDPFEELIVLPGGFNLDFYGGAGWRWSEEYQFRYDKLKKTWMFFKQNSTYFHAGDPDKTMQNATITRAEAGDISLADFNPEYNTDSSWCQVKAAKTFFYSSPQATAKPRKAYLVKGDKIQAAKVFKNYIRCTFENNGQFTEGYILKKDLELLGAQ